MKDIKMTATVPSKELSTVIELIESVGGSLINVEMEEDGRKRKQQKRRKALTHELLQQILSWKNKHPAWTNKEIGAKFDVSASQVGSILTGKTALQRELAKAQGGKKK